ncbi:NADH:flavin oxidoreductase/NADH oxidase [Parachlamydia sp. AcF125]|uniref:NADH:flavin oxidoreductase/NADH oxidase n=1 Tax=Parachlamydia sp. AcF125 TaxID=2795736 RepID=UPI001BC958AB|nr:NADH:flavin oxidoreductase/NADH oxidase [Parachlamydia sp. AcF125]MBS4167590.1 NADPH dehydrogenase [Parachlamydia sp. AcF125]
MKEEMGHLPFPPKRPKRIAPQREHSGTDLFSPLKIRGITLKNRIAMSPMCQYCAKEGMPNDWHLVHLGSRAAGGVSLVMVEANAVTQKGRITPFDMGIWHDDHVSPHSRLVEFIQSQGAVPAIQLAHSGRKGSRDVPWRGGNFLKTACEGGWKTVAPSPLPFIETDPWPEELNEAGIQEILNSFESACKRALKAGYKIIEIHSAHGYLLHQFLSPLSNHRTDQYGGSLENRMRLPLQVAQRLRAIMPENLPLFVRISGTDWVEGGWDIHQSVVLAKSFQEVGVDLIDVSSGGMVPQAQIPLKRGYQVPLARQVRENAKILTGAVGLITEPHYANQIVIKGNADLVFIGRELLREPYWALKAEYAIANQLPAWPIQYGYAVEAS